MRVRVLGAVVIIDPGGRTVARPERKARELLTTLVLAAPGAVALDELVDLLWDAPPESATRTISAHVSRLRSALESAGIEGGIERSGHAAYRLVLPPGTTDVATVADLRARARHLMKDGSADSAAPVLAEARRAWRGDPELPDTLAATALLRGWQREHRQLVLEHLQCLVAGPDPGQALGELERHAVADPADEAVAVLRIQALRRSGQQSEAVRAAATARAALAELGLVAGARLRRAEAEAFAGERGWDDAPGTWVHRGDAQDHRGETGSGPSVQYTVADGRHVAHVVLSEGPRDLVVLNPAMITIDGLLDESHARDALRRLSGHARVVCLDRRGIGLSDPLEPQRDPLHQWTDDVVEVLDARGIATAHLFANFDTGLVAIEVAVRHPERVASLVLAHCFASYQRRPGYPHGVEPTTARQLIQDAVAPGEPEHRLDTVSQAAPTVAGDAAFRRWWTRIGQRGAGPATAMAIRTIATETDLRDRLPHVRAPTLVLHRRNCQNVDVGHARHLADHIPDAELVMLPGADALWFTGTADLVDRTVEFLRAR